MKLYNKIGAFTLVLGVIMSSCAVNDPFANNLDLGQVVPTVSWELGSTVCKAGEEVSFKGKYYTTSGKVIDRSEVWVSVQREELSTATCKLTSSLAYTQTFTGSDTVRSSQFVQSYPHKDEYWNGHEFELISTFKTSQTLSPLSWTNPKKWSDVEENKFATYFPESFKKEFVETVIDYLTKDSTYYTDLKLIYEKYNFTAEQFQALNVKHNLDFPIEIEAEKKTDLWYTNTTKVTGKYYITIDDKGKTTMHEVKLGEEPDGVILYDVYDSAKWVFCYYSDDAGRVITLIRPQYMPYIKDLLSLIQFQDWIYSTDGGTYNVNFSRIYKLTPLFKVFEKDGKIGTDTEKKEIDLI